MQTPSQTHWYYTEHYGLLGTPIKKSLSPLMHNANFTALKRNAVYHFLEVEAEDFANVVRSLAPLKFRGINVTMPYKKDIIPFLDGLDEMGALCKSVNTVAVKDGKMTGTNTDGRGLVRSLQVQGSFATEGKSCVMTGSGGAGRGISFALAEAGIGRVTILDIPEAKPMLDELVSDLNAYKSGLAEGKILSPETMAATIPGADVVINATPVGIVPNVDECPIDVNLLHEGQTVGEVLYYPPRTKLLEEAAKRGCVTVEGYWMLIWQGIESYRFWTGEEADFETMKDTVLRAIAHK